MLTGVQASPVAAAGGSVGGKTSVLSDRLERYWINVWAATVATIIAPPRMAHREGCSP
jgi:hypothetical protein